jgi:tetratricopeptide (TPR) repeat protein
VIHRPTLLTVALAAIVAAASLVWVEVRQDRQFRLQIAVGEAALSEDQSFAAIEAFSGALVLKPDSMLAHLKRGDAYRRREEFTAALRDLTEAAALDETAPQPIEMLGDVNAALGRHDRAAEFYQRYLQLDDRAMRVLYKLALSHVRSGQSERAIEPLRRVLGFDERFAEAHYLLGMSLHANRQYDEALRALRRAVALDAGFIAAREELASFYAARGRSRECIEELEAIAALEPGRPERLVEVALTYARWGRRERAIQSLGQAAERYPNAPSIYTALGRVWLETAAEDDDPVALAKAIQALQPLASRSDATGETLALYGRALLRSGNPAQAEPVLQQAVAHLPVDTSTYRDLADAAQRLGHADIARDAQARYAALAAGS